MFEWIREEDLCIQYEIERNHTRTFNLQLKYQNHVIDDIINVNNISWIFNFFWAVKARRVQGFMEMRKYTYFDILDIKV